jgi:hypothetical protein
VIVLFILLGVTYLCVMLNRFAYAAICMAVVAFVLYCNRQTRAVFAGDCAPV